MSQSFERSGNSAGSQEGYYAIDEAGEARLKSLAKEVAKKTKNFVLAVSVMDIPCERRIQIRF